MSYYVPDESVIDRFIQGHGCWNDSHVANHHIITSSNYNNNNNNSGRAVHKYTEWRGWTWGAQYHGETWATETAAEKVQAANACV